MHYKLYPWIPLVGVLLVACNSEKDTGLDNQLVFFTSAIWQVISIVIIGVGVVA